MVAGFQQLLNLFIARVRKIDPSNSKASAMNKSFLNIGVGSPCSVAFAEEKKSRVFSERRSSSAKRPLLQDNISDSSNAVTEAVRVIDIFEKESSVLCNLFVFEVFGLLYYFIPFGSNASRSPQICRNVTQVTQILVKCRNHLKIR